MLKLDRSSQGLAAGCQSGLLGINDMYIYIYTHTRTHIYIYIHINIWIFVYNNSKPRIWELFIPPIYADLGDGLLLFYPQYIYIIYIERYKIFSHSLHPLAVGLVSIPHCICDMRDTQYLNRPTAMFQSYFRIIWSLLFYTSRNAKKDRKRIEL